MTVLHNAFLMHKPQLNRSTIFVVGMAGGVSYLLDLWLRND